MAETRVLEAKLESIRGKASDVVPSLHRMASCDSSGQYLEWEKQLETEMNQIQSEMSQVKQEVEDLNGQVKLLMSEE